MSEQASLKKECYLDADGKVVGILVETDDWTVREGEVTPTSLSYPYTRVLPIEYLVADGDPKTIRSLTLEEEQLMVLVTEAEEHRDEMIMSPLGVHGGMWKMETKDRENIQDAIAEVEASNLPDDYVQHWILANGDIFPATVGKLQQVLSAYRARKQAIYGSYITWLSSGPTSEWTCEVNNVYTFPGD